ncbi:sulfurtransferase [Microbacterium sp.]|uniref:sulfurtransferase n=1 Tax=Microbacterium sp. TaxID=51671 RepID=UPI0039E5351A
MSAPFLSVAELHERMDAGEPVVLADSRWYLDGRSGREAYLGGHLPGAVFVDIDTDLAGARGPLTGRHPLPSAQEFAAAMSRLGIADSDTVVAYDDAGGVMAARLVWMLRALGVDAALLDGGIDAWDGELSTGEVVREPAAFAPRPWPEDLLADLDDAADPRTLVVDARPAERFAGEGPDPDPRSGHIPGAASVPCRENVDAGQRLLPLDTLRARFAAAGVTPERVAEGEIVSSCGSGVTACHNLLTMEAAGLGRARLYPGSWSQYAATDRPIETGR